ncbi:MAG: hypothetical protein KJ070_22990 [Verrucomicrobia bacterium]|nr:hypothetical protein [Verrucomicrobiota bacterium]
MADGAGRLHSGLRDLASYSPKFFLHWRGRHW